MPKDQFVERPTKRSEYRIICATRQAQKGWQDLRATTLSALADAWDALTRDPLRDDPTCHPLTSIFHRCGVRRRDGAGAVVGV